MRTPALIMNIFFSHLRQKMKEKSFFRGLTIASNVAIQYLKSVELLFKVNIDDLVGVVTFDNKY